MTVATDELDSARDAYHQALYALVQGDPARLADVADPFARAAASYRHGEAAEFEQVGTPDCLR